jgi:osmotically-inducible protein OsmY
LPGIKSQADAEVEIWEGSSHMATTTQARSDNVIRNDVLYELKWDPRISSNGIAVVVRDGVVTLSGYATSYWEKDAAEKAVKRVYGVKAVANDIQIKFGSIRPSVI